MKRLTGRHLLQRSKSRSGMGFREAVFGKFVG